MLYCCVVTPAFCCVTESVPQTQGALSCSRARVHSVSETGSRKAPEVDFLRRERGIFKCLMIRVGWDSPEIQTAARPSQREPSGCYFISGLKNSTWCKQLLWICLSSGHGISPYRLQPWKGTQARERGGQRVQLNPAWMGCAPSHTSCQGCFLPPVTRHEPHLFLF